MKEFVDIHDFLVSEQVVGDWDGNEELVAEHLNEFYHTIYAMVEDDIPSEHLEHLLNQVWDLWIGQDELVDIEIDEIQDWCHNFLANRDSYLED